MFRLLSSAGLASVGLALALATAAHAESHTVQMYSAHPTDPSKVNSFDPPLLRIAPGDGVTFVPANPSHNSASKKGMIPEGAEAWNSGVDEEFTVTLTTEGVYGYICSPHYEMCMVGLIVVGDPAANLEAARKVRHIGAAKKVFRDLFAQLEEG